MIRRELFRVLPAVWLAAAGAVAAQMLDLSGRSLLLWVFAGAALGTGWAWLIALQKERAIRDISAQVREMLERTGATGQAIDSGGGSLRDLRATMSALSARVVAQVKELAKKSRNLEALIDGLEEPVLATDKNDEVLLCNRAAEALVGVRPGELIGRNVRELFTREEVLAMHASARDGKPAGGQAPVPTPQGTRTFQISAAPLPAAWGPGVFGAVMVLRDVTELAQAVQMRTDFVANASHELRTPVAAIKMAAETLLDGASDDPAMLKKLLAMIASHSERLEEMVRDLMDLSRLESPEHVLKPSALDLDELKANLAQVFEPVLRQKSLELRFELEDGLDGLRTDTRLLQLILRNLVDNATKYAHAQTTVRVAGRMIEWRDERGPIRAARFEVIDKGVGIPLAQQERVFERFYQVDPARTGTSTRRGTGLGLSIVKHAVIALGGKVGLESVWGAGTKVWVEVPAMNLEAARGGAGGAASDEAGSPPAG